jgi:hypothetical protein
VLKTESLMRTGVVVAYLLACMGSAGNAFLCVTDDGQVKLECGGNSDCGPSGVAPAPLTKADENLRLFPLSECGNCTHILLSINGAHLLMTPPHLRLLLQQSPALATFLCATLQPLAGASAFFDPPERLPGDSTLSSLRTIVLLT